MLYIFFLRILNEDTNSCLPSPPPLTPKTNPCDTSSTPGSITFNEDSTQIVLYPQYKINDNDWQDDTLFTNLTPDTLYKFTARYRSYPTSIESQYSYICKSSTPTYPPIMTINLVKTIRQDTNDIQTDSGSKDQHSMNIKSIKRKQTYSYVNIDPPIVEILEINDTSSKLKTIQPITVNVDVEYHMSNGEWQDNPTFITGIGTFYFSARYQSIEVPDIGPPIYIKTMQIKSTISCNQKHTCEHFHGSLLFILFICQKDYSASKTT